MVTIIMSKHDKPAKLEEKNLEFEFEIGQAQFNKNGTYFLKLSVQNSHRQDLLPKVSLDVNNSGDNIQARSTQTDSVVWGGSEQFVNFARNRFKFRLPKGFCKNDLNYDVYLMIEASLQRSSRKADHVGEARIAIYPRTDAPKANLLAKKGRDYYHYKSVLTLLRPRSKATFSMHCGRLSYSIALREFIKFDNLLQSETSDDETVNEVEMPPRNPKATPAPLSRLPQSSHSSTKKIPQSSHPPPSKIPQPSHPLPGKIPQTPHSPPSRLSQSHPNLPTSPTNLPTTPLTSKILESSPEKFLKQTSPPASQTTFTRGKSRDKPYEVEREEYQPEEDASLDEDQESNPQLVDGIRPGKLQNEIEEVFNDYITGKANGYDVNNPSRGAPFSSGSAVSFHLSLPSTPLPHEPPTYREKTMDQPSGGASTPAHSSGKSPTITSPRSGSFAAHPTHVAQPGYQEVLAIVHGATSLPSPSDGSDPLPFVTMKSCFEEEGNRPAQTSTHAPLSPTHSPRWEEVMLMKVDEDRAESEEAIVTIADDVSREKLVTFRVPFSHLVPFHSYHFELIQPTTAIPAGVRLFITMQRRLSHLPRLESFGFCALEVTLRDFQYELMDPPDPLIAVLRIVPDYSKYRSDMLSRRPLPAGITGTPVTFPSPNPTSFAVMKKSLQGHPHITLPSKQGTQPEWNQPLIFTSSDTPTIFAPNSALVIELYPSATLMSSVTWSIRNPVGFCTVLLNDDVYRALTADEGKMGIRMDDLLIQGSQFVTKTGVFPSLRITMRLITTERPDALVAVADADILPQFDFIPSRPQDSPAPSSDDYEDPIVREETPVGGPPLERKKTRILVKDDEFPPSDAIRDLLPEYAMTESDVTIGAARAPQERNAMKKTTNQKTKKDVNHGKSLLDHQSQELEKYRDAVRRMSVDIVTLRRSIGQLQEENALLRRELLMNREMGQDLMNDLHRGVISSGEVADKFVAVKQKLAKETDDVKKYKSKVQNLHNQMIKANDREKGYLLQSASKKDLEQTIRHQEEKLKKSKKLEETCVQQEKVIQKMERLLSKYMKTSSNQQHVTQEASKPEDRQNTVTLLGEENAKLLLELDRLKAEKQRSDDERAELMDRARRAEHRTSSLEAQLDHNARSWAKERHELTVRLQEHRNGIVRTSTDPLL